MHFKLRRWIIKIIVGKLPVMMNLNVEVQENSMFVLNDRVVYYNNKVS